MVKIGEVLKKEDIPFLEQLVNSLEEASKKLEDAYNKKNSENFNKAKRLMLDLQGKISEGIK